MEGLSSYRAENTQFQLYKTSLLGLCKAKVAVGCEIRTKLINVM
jgi:hypothetical protein